MNIGVEVQEQLNDSKVTFLGSFHQTRRSIFILHIYQCWSVIEQELHEFHMTVFPCPRQGCATIIICLVRFKITPL
jgi:hypothetical protein